MTSVLLNRSFKAVVAGLIATLLMMRSAPAQVLSNRAMVSDAAQRILDDKSLPTLRQAVNILSQVTIETKASCVVTRRDTVNRWIQLLSAIHSAQDPTFNSDDIRQLPTTRVDVPGSTNYLPGTDPRNVTDHQTRIAYEKALAENNEKLQHVNYEQGLRNINNDTMLGLRITLMKFASCPNDNAAISQSLKSAGLNQSQIQDLEQLTF